MPDAPQPGRRRASTAKMAFQALAGATAAILMLPAASAQSSHTCEFAAAGWIALQIDLREAQAD